MAFSLDNLRRRQFVNRSIREASKALAVPEVRRRLGHYAVLLDQISRSLYAAEIVPDADMFGAEMRIPREKVGTNGIPVVAMRLGETAVLSPDFGHLTPIQSKAARQWGLDKGFDAQGADGLMANIQKSSRTKGTRLGVSLVGRELALVISDVTRTSIEVPTSGSALYSVNSLPLLILKYPEEARGARRWKSLPGPIMLHECTHLYQEQTMPIFPAAPGEVRDHYLRHELEAHHVGANAVLGLREAGKFVRIQVVRSWWRRFDLRLMVREGICLHPTLRFWTGLQH